MCMAPLDVEILIKTCRQGAPLIKDICEFNYKTNILMCEVMGPVDFTRADNYACTSKKDLQRILGRCKP